MRQIIFVNEARVEIAPPEYRVEDDVKIATEDKPVSEWKADEILKYVREDI